MKRSGEWVFTLLGSVFIGALNTIGDIVWDNWISSHRLYLGLLHGVILCAAMGLVLGVAVGGRGAASRGPMIAVLIGLLSAGSYYLFAPWLGYGSMLLSWLFLWCLLAWLAQALEDAPQKKASNLSRGVGAGILSGLAFYLILDVWLNPSAEPNYLYNFGAWTFAFLPGFLVLLLGRKGPSPTQRLRPF